MGNNMAHGWRREVCAANQHVGLAVPLQEGLPCLMCLDSVKIRAGYPGGFGASYRAMDHIAGDDSVGTVGGQMHADVIRGMAWCWFQPHFVIEGIVVGHEGGQTRLDNRQHAIGKMLQWCGVVHRLPVLPLLAGYDVGGIGERWYPASVAQLRIPADMIHMQMRAQDVIHRFRVHTSGRQLSEEYATRGHMPARALPFLVVADAGVDENGMVASAHEPGLHRED